MGERAAGHRDYHGYEADDQVADVVLLGWGWCWSWLRHRALLFQLLPQFFNFLLLLLALAAELVSGREGALLFGTGALTLGFLLGLSVLERLGGLLAFLDEDLALRKSLISLFGSVLTAVEFCLFGFEVLCKLIELLLTSLRVIFTVFFGCKLFLEACTEL